MKFSRIREFYAYRWEEQRVEQDVGEIAREKIKMSIDSLKNQKASGTNGIPVDLLKFGVKTLHKNIYESTLIIWKEE